MKKSCVESQHLWVFKMLGGSFRISQSQLPASAQGTGEHRIMDMANCESFILKRQLRGLCSLFPTHL